MMRRHAALVVAAWAALVTPAQAAFEFSGTKSITAVTADGGRLRIGTVQFSPAADGGAAFKLVMATELFNDHFLSMREFKCLPAAQEITCHVPYPYPQPATVRPGQLAWLEHSLLFFFKKPADFGAKLWNGVYFELREQGDALVGTPQAIDLNEIGAPPANPSVAPYGKARRHEMPAGARWVQQLRIE